MSTAVATAVEILQFPEESVRATRLLAALASSARAVGIDATVTTQYRGGTPWLVFWGPGAPARAAVMDRHLLAGGHALVFDLAYWQRETKVRVSIDAAHPWAWVMRETLPASRFLADRVHVDTAWHPHGPIVVAGIGEKARVQYGAEVIDAWERSMITACRERWPGRVVSYRKKKMNSPEPAGVNPMPYSIPIDQALRGASLVVTWHSNVAVDAIRMGIPVVCRDGAAAAVCPSTLSATDPAPLPIEVRDRFLANLAWFQWAPTEGAAFWRWAQERLAS